MHIPDGFLEPAVWIPAAPVAAAGVAYALKRTNESLGERQVPLLGVTGAFIFAAQMINFPVAPGVSGHLIGAVLAAMLLGPHAAALVITVVLTIQALVFQDGGVTALGANIVNLALVSSYGGYGVVAVMRRLLGGGDNGWRISVAAGAFASVVLAALACAAELILSGVIDPVAGFTLLGGVHVLIGLGEAVITVGVLSFVRQTRPDLIAGTASWRRAHEAA